MARNCAVRVHGRNVKVGDVLNRSRIKTVQVGRNTTLVTIVKRGEFIPLTFKNNEFVTLRRPKYNLG